MSKLFQSKAFGRILRLVLLIVEKILILRLLEGRRAACPYGSGLVPMDSWVEKSWQEIQDLWKQGGLALADGRILVCDGELGRRIKKIAYG